MNKNQTKHFRMMENVTITMDENDPKWNGVPVIVKQKNDLDELVNPVIEAALERIKELADYGTTEEQVTDVRTTLDSFTALIGQPRNIRNRSFAAISQIEDLIDNGMELLNERLDKLMLMFKQSEPQFFEQYMRARVIVD